MLLMHLTLLLTVQKLKFYISQYTVLLNATLRKKIGGLIFVHDI